MSSNSAIHLLQPVAESAFDLTAPAFSESSLGNLVTDAYRAEINAELQVRHDHAAPPREAPVALTIEAGGLLGDELRRGETGQLWFADIYRALATGIGPDQQPGYPLVTVHLSGREIKQGLELLANAEDVLQNNDYFLHVSGVTVRYEKQRPPFDRVTAVTLDDRSGAIDLSDTRTCYHVGMNYYLATMLTQVKEATGGAIDIQPKKRNCRTVINDLSTRIVRRDSGSGKAQELKTWQALQQYLAKLADTNGNKVPDLPAAYQQPQGRILATP